MSSVSREKAGASGPPMESKFSHYQLGKERRMITVTVKSLLQISFELFTKLVGVSLESLLSLLSRLLGIDSGLVAQTGEVKLTGIIEIIRQPGLVDDKSQSVPTSGNAQQDAGGLWDLAEMYVRPPMGWAAGLVDEC